MHKCINGIFFESYAKMGISEKEIGNKCKYKYFQAHSQSLFRCSLGKPIQQQPRLLTFMFPLDIITLTNDYPSGFNCSLQFNVKSNVVYKVSKSKAMIETVG